ncbi:MAG TPA: hypothetical protein VMD97_01920 [Candidatus Aquilonibacter sp.]|nr:hypothetical protein [Candidatus Aquilonibacter sp.]
MTVAELIEKLQGMQSQLEVYLRYETHVMIPHPSVFVATYNGVPVVEIADEDYADPYTWPEKTINHRS